MKRTEIHADREVLIELVKKLNKVEGDDWNSVLSPKGLVIWKEE